MLLLLSKDTRVSGGGESEKDWKISFSRSLVDNFEGWINDAVY